MTSIQILLIELMKLPYMLYLLSQDVWQDIDPDEYVYEELVALGEVVGTESRGLSADMIASLPSVNYKAENMQDDNSEQYAYISIRFLVSFNESLNISLLTSK
ncbi:hypothetical protein B296_00051359 [Ensete ventricosum]|uniref:Uncharacterized protein n=1 Tax=Ensete ventricosum TaxID=4639 RepID=A0A426YGY8_ENSVE|nr:hypothetical protein B296_00051359 [Ensete ventricosum]